MFQSFPYVESVLSFLLGWSTSRLFPPKDPSTSTRIRPLSLKRRHTTEIVEYLHFHTYFLPESPGTSYWGHVQTWHFVRVIGEKEGPPQ